MKKSFSTLFLFLLFFTALHAQDDDSLADAYESYFELPRESIFLHLNKSIYVAGEEIWFKGYVYDRKYGLPFTNTTNIYVELYNSLGNPVDSRLVMGANGYAMGNIPIDSTYASGDYFIRASTNWMKNFTEDDSFVQKIKIINREVKTEELGEISYDLQLLPEGGHLVEGVESIVGVKLIDNQGRGVSFERGALINPSGVETMDFKGNDFGMASFPFLSKYGDYKVRILLKDGSEMTSTLPKVHKKGIVLRILNNQGDSEVLFSIATNKNTLKDIRRNKYRLLIHKDGSAINTTVSFSNAQREVVIPMERKLLFTGVNTVTLMDRDNRPIAERLFFNHYEMKPIEPTVEFAGKIRDSLSISLTVPPIPGVAKNLSVSVLPEATRAYGGKLSTLSEFLLKPYVKGYIENPAHYFSVTNERKAYDLDLLLLTQGWGRYDWGDIFNGEPDPNFPFENGLTLKGTFNTTDIEKFPRFLMGDSKYHDSRIVELEGASFEIPNMLIEKGEEIEVKLIRKNTKVESKGLYARVIPSSKPSPKMYPKSWNTPDIYLTNFPDSDYRFEEGTIVLDEVKLVEEKQEFANILSKKEIEIDQKLALMYPRVTDIIRMKGYNVYERALGKVVIGNRRRGSNPPPVIYFNGTRIVSQSRVSLDTTGLNVVGDQGFDFLFELRTSEIEKIEIDPDIDVTEGSRGLGGVIKIWTRKTPLLGTEKEEKRKNYIDTINGFDVPKKFYTPKYFYEDPKFEYIGVIHWEPQLVPDDEGKVIFNIADTGIGRISFFIEGMAEDGSLISTVKTIEVTKKSSP